MNASTASDLPAFDDSGLRFVVLHDCDARADLEPAADFASAAEARRAFDLLNRWGCTGLNIIDRGAPTETSDDEVEDRTQDSADLEPA